VPGKREQCNGRGINVGGALHTERNAVTRIPPTTRAHTVEEHADAQLNPLNNDSLQIDTPVPDLP
jgi:hypothetical protein